MAVSEGEQKREPFRCRAEPFVVDVDSPEYFFREYGANASALAEAAAAYYSSKAAAAAPVCRELEKPSEAIRDHINSVLEGVAERRNRELKERFDNILRLAETRKREEASLPVEEAEPESGGNTAVPARDADKASATLPRAGAAELEGRAFAAIQAAMERAAATASPPLEQHGSGGGSTAAAAAVPATAPLATAVGKTEVAPATGPVGNLKNVDMQKQFQKALEAARGRRVAEAVQALSYQDTEGDWHSNAVIPEAQAWPTGALIGEQQGLQQIPQEDVWQTPTLATDVQTVPSHSQELAWQTSALVPEVPALHASSRDAVSLWSAHREARALGAPPGDWGWCTWKAGTSSPPASALSGWTPAVKQQVRGNQDFAGLGLVEAQLRAHVQDGYRGTREFYLEDLTTAATSSASSAESEDDLDFSEPLREILANCANCLQRPQQNLQRPLPR